MNTQFSKASKYDNRVSAFHGKLGNAQMHTLPLEAHRAHLHFIASEKCFHKGTLNFVYC